ncbi:MAG: hypothetical protein HZC29_03270 [Thaumarchaeota archaeon]|nr:hypothetical protein [Nitrososphaerota archaeon]
MNVTILSIMSLVIGGLVLQPIFAESELPPVYQDSQFILDKYRYTYGDTITVTVISPLNNTDPTVPDTIMTTYLDVDGSSPRHETDLRNRSLIESGPDTGIFIGKFQIVNVGDKPSENLDSVDGYLEVSPNSDYVTVMFKNLLGDSTSGLSAEFTHPTDTTPPDGFTNRTVSAYPNAQFRWKESISPYEGTGIIRVVYPEQNISDKVDSLVVRLIQDYDYGRIYATLTETDKDTGIFETEIPVTTRYSPTKLTLKPSQWQGVSVAYYVDDRLDRNGNDGFTLYNSLASPYSERLGVVENPITIHTDNDWHFSQQQIVINGQAEPNEDLNIVVFSKKANGQEKFRHVKTTSSGSFDTAIEWNEPRFFSGQHIIQVIGSKHDIISEKEITIISMDELRSRSITVSPKQQTAMGLLPNDIVCHQVWKTVLKPDGKTPVCLEPPTAFKLEKRGWTILHKTNA